MGNNLTIAFNSLSVQLSAILYCDLLNYANIARVILIALPQHHNIGCQETTFGILKLNTFSAGGHEVLIDAISKRLIK